MNWLGDHFVAWLPGVDSGLTRRVIIFTEDRQVVVDHSGNPLFAKSNDFRLKDTQQFLIGSFNGTTYFAVQITETSDFKFEPLRQILVHIDSDIFIPVNAALQILEFNSEHRFCGRCGLQIVASGLERGRRCEPCNLVQYPRISPCIIVLVTRGEEILLARSPRFVDGMYSTLAGFVEAGESVEHACYREIFEEVGVEIENLVYQGSQSWPFKHSLMLGYQADWKSGDIQIDSREIIDAKWFTIEDLPKLPPKASISRGMIDAFVTEHSN